MSKANLELLSVHKGRLCNLCNVRNSEESLLNIEGGIHHHTPPTCLDKKACRRRQRKQKKDNLQEEKI